MELSAAILFRVKKISLQKIPDKSKGFFVEVASSKVVLFGSYPQIL